MDLTMASSSPQNVEAGESRSGGNDAKTNINNGSNAATPTDIAKKRHFTKKLGLQRQVYHEMTSLRKFPLQEMSIRDVEENLKDYLAAAPSGDDVDSLSDSDNSSEDGDRRQKEVTAAAGAAASITKISPKQGRATCQEEHTWREQFTKEFLQEKSLPVVVMTTNTNQLVRSSRATTVNNAVPTLTQEIADFLPFLDAAIERHCDENDSNSVSSGSSALENNTETSSQTNDKENILLDNDNNKQSCVTFQEVGNCEQTKKDMAPSSIFIFEDEEEDAKEISDDTQSTSKLPVLWSFEPRMFAMETALHGKRRYISAHLGRFIDHYWRECDANNRHYYELIREDTPCRLYFDLEFNKKYNPQLTTATTEDLLTELFEEIQHQFELFYSIPVHRSDMVDLDSSTDKKFSRHWIIHLPEGLLFDDARAAGIFVKAMVSRLDKERKAGSLQAKGRSLLAEYLYVNAEEVSDDEKVKPKKTCIIDLGVYTRNRLFRLLGSKKFGKTSDATLRIAETNEFLFPTQFVGRMAGVETPSASKSRRENESDTNSFEKFCNSMSWEAHAEALAATLVVPANSAKIKFPTLPHPLELLDEEEQAQLCITPRFGGSARTPRGCPEYGKSPFPALDHFIVNTLGKRENLVGNIGTWTLDYLLQPLPQMICYNMRDNRYCEHVGRAHKSNNIIWNVHLIDRVCWQTCHDPECRGAKFRGKPIDLPEDVNMEIGEFFLEHELSTLNEGHVLRSNTKNEAGSREEKAHDFSFSDPELEQAMLQLNIEEKKVSEIDNTGDGSPNSHAKVESEEPWDDDDKLDSELLEVALTLPQVFS